MRMYCKFSAWVLLLCFSACSKKQGAQTQEKTIPVKVMEVAAGQAAGGKSYVGTVEESAAVSLAFSLMGTVEEVFVQEGQRVHKGQLLAALNAATSENSYQVSLAKLRQAQDAYDRLTKVHENGSLPDIKLVEVEAGLLQAKSMAAIAKKNLEDCKLYAPRDGVMAERNVEAGGSVIPAQAAFRLVSVDKVFVKIPVPENEIGSIAEGQAAHVTVAALGNAAFSGKVEIKGVSANAASHTYEAKIGVNNRAGASHALPLLLPGMVCKVTLAGSSGAAEIVVPNRAVQIAADGRQYVWLAKGGIAKRRFVKTGNLTDSGIAIAEGLSAGDSLIIEGFQKVSEGTKISTGSSLN